MEELREAAKRIAKGPTERYKEFDVMVERDIERIRKRIQEAEVLRATRLQRVSGRK
jgi:hypothetical protein